MDVNKLGLELLCLTSLSTICQLYCGGHVYWWRKPEFLQPTFFSLHYYWLCGPHLQPL